MTQIASKSSSLTTQSAARLAWSLAAVGLGTAPDLGKLFVELTTTLQVSV